MGKDEKRVIEALGDWKYPPIKNDIEKRVWKKMSLWMSNVKTCLETLKYTHDCEYIHSELMNPEIYTTVFQLADHKGKVITTKMTVVNIGGQNLNISDLNHMAWRKETLKIVFLE